MKLQINTAGVWKNLIEFDEKTVEVIDSVLYHARSLLAHETGRSSMRITDDKHIPKLYLDGPGKSWRRAGHPNHQES